MKQTSAPFTAQVSATGRRSSSSSRHSARSPQRDRGGDHLADERPTTGRTGRYAIRPSATTVSRSRRAASRSPARARNPAATACACAGAPTHQRTASAAICAQLVGVGRGPARPRAAGTSARCRCRCRRRPRRAPPPRRSAGRRVSMSPSSSASAACAGPQQVVVPGLAQALGDVGDTRSKRGAERGGAVLQLGVGGEQQPLRRAVPGPSARVARSAISRGDRDPRGGGAGRPQVSCWASRQLASVAGSSSVAGDGDRLLGQRPGARAVGGHRVLQLTGQGRGHLGLGRAARVRAVPSRAASSTATRLVAGHREPGAEAVQAQRHRAEQLGVAGGAASGPGGVEQSPRAARGVARACSRRSASVTSRPTRSAPSG